MSKQRFISVSFWDDAWIQTLDPSEKLLYLYLMTNPLTNIAGVYKITNRRICFDTGFNLDTVTHILRKFETAKKVYRFDEYIVIPNWCKHQKWQVSPKIKQGIDLILKELEPELLKFLSDCNYTYPIDTVSIDHQYSSNYSDLDSDLDRDSDKDIKKKPQIPDGISDHLLELSLEFHKKQKDYGRNHIDFKQPLTKESKVVIQGAVELDKLQRLDKVELSTIEKVLRFIPKDDFWGDNCVSLAGIRKRGKNGNAKFFNILNATKSTHESKMERIMAEADRLRGEA